MGELEGEPSLALGVRVCCAAVHATLIDALANVLGHLGKVDFGRFCCPAIRPRRQHDVRLDTANRLHQIDKLLVVARQADGIGCAVGIKLGVRGVVRRHAKHNAAGLHTLNLGRLLKGEQGPRSCTPAGVMVMLRDQGIDPAGKRAVVVGRSILVGQPMALMLQAANATVTVAHSRTQDLESITRQAEILVWQQVAPK